MQYNRKSFQTNMGWFSLRPELLTDHAAISDTVLPGAVEEQVLNIE